MERAESNSHICVQIAFEMVPRILNGERLVFSVNDVGKLDNHMLKVKLDPELMPFPRIANGIMT